MIRTQEKVSNLQMSLTELGNAERLVLHCGNEIRYCPPAKKWMVYQNRSLLGPLRGSARLGSVKVDAFPLGPLMCHAWHRSWLLLLSLAFEKYGSLWSVFPCC